MTDNDEPLPYTLVLTNRASHDLSRLDKAIARQIRQKLAWLTYNADIVQHFSMKGAFRENIVSE